MKIIQMLPSMAYGDAIGNDVLALYDVLKKNHYETEIYAQNIDPRLPKKLVSSIEKVPKLKEDDVIIWHMAIGTELNEYVLTLPGKKIMIYHNITPANFFEPYSIQSSQLCMAGEEQLRKICNSFDYCLADSGYNKKDLIERGGCTKKIDVLPILIPFSDYEKKPNENVIKKYGDDGYTNILFTGRIAPNKKQEDLIRAFYMYHKYYNPKSRLIFVGNYGGMESYYNKLRGYVKDLELEDVLFTGHIKFDEILAYYRVSDVFLCMSEHEGFCVPLVEAMCFDLPIIAYDSSAIGDTLGGSGILIQKKDPLETAGMIDYLVKNKEFYQQVVEGQRERLKDFEHDKIEKKFMEYLRAFLGEQDD